MQMEMGWLYASKLQSHHIYSTCPFSLPIAYLLNATWTNMQKLLLHDDKTVVCKQEDWYKKKVSDVLLQLKQQNDILSFYTVVITKFAQLLIFMLLHLLSNCISKTERNSFILA
jgi:hypothetical protein